VWVGGGGSERESESESERANVCVCGVGGRVWDDGSTGSALDIDERATFYPCQFVSVSQLRVWLVFLHNVDPQHQAGAIPTANGLGLVPVCTSVQQGTASVVFRFVDHTTRARSLRR
jgi:hypothetical protein